QRPDRRQFGGPFLGFHRLGRHRRRLRREGGADEAFDHHGFDRKLEIGKASGQRRQQSQRNQEHDRSASDERKLRDHEQQPQYRAPNNEDERGNRSVNEGEL